MPWVRIDEKALLHPKIRGLSDGAFRLWVEGLTHCQMFLTDGYIKDGDCRALLAYSPKRKAALVSVGLWEESETGVRVHDYLQWNESREHVMEVRRLAKERMAKRRGGSEDVRENVRANTQRTSLIVPSGVLVKGKESVENRDPSPSEVSEDINARAGRFVNETYPALYVKHRKGAHYAPKPHLDYQNALVLCQTWDDARLEKIAVVFLTTDHQFAENGSRSIGQLRALASWCDGRLTERGL